MANDSTTTLSEPLASLTASALFRLQASCYVVVACLTMCVWDWLLTFSDELEMICCGGRCRRSYLNMLYLVVRVCPIIYLTSALILGGGTTGATRVLTILIAAVNMITIPAASALFFIRLRAVYLRNTLVTTFFGFCWLVVLALFVFDSVRGMRQCVNVDKSTKCFDVHHVDAYGYIAAAAYDTLMYFAVSCRLASFAPYSRWQDRVRSFVTGDGLGWLSKVLLQSGQFYYFVMISFAMFTVLSMYCLPENSWRGVTMVPNVAVTSLMACRLFRELKLGLSAGPTTNDVSNIVFRDMHSHTGPDFELHHLSDEGMVIDRKRGVSAVSDESFSGGDIETLG